MQQSEQERTSANQRMPGGNVVLCGRFITLGGRLHRRRINIMCPRISDILLLLNADNAYNFADPLTRGNIVQC